MVFLVFSGNCDVEDMASMALKTSGYLSFVPKEGLQYFVTVEATNGAGLKDITFSDGIKIDTSPPVIPGIYHGFERVENNEGLVMFQNVGDHLEFFWDLPYDRESGISSVEWCAGTNKDLCDIVSLTLIGTDDTFVKYSLSNCVDSGTILVMNLVVTNGIGLTSKVVTSPLLIDTTPPSVGNVNVGNTTKLKYFKKEDLITAELSGFVDKESQLSHFEWAICQVSVSNECVSPYVNIGIKTAFKFGVIGLHYGVSYAVNVRAFNKAGLFSKGTSNLFTVDHTGPSAGIVYDGLQRGKDIAFQNSTTQLSANWSPFTNSNGRIAEYEMCVGKEPETCDVKDFVSLGKNWRGTITGLNLKHNEKYFVTVQATTESGYRTTATSNGIQVDSSLPVSGKVRDGQTLTDIDYQADDSYIYANWDEFLDEESGVIGYTWCAGTGKRICDIVPETDVSDNTSISREIRPPLPRGIKIFITVMTSNKAGASSTSSSDGFVVDYTAPVITEVSK